MKPVKHFKGALALLYIIINLTLGLIPLLILALLKFILPITAVKNKLYRLMLGIYTTAVWVDIFLFRNLLGIHFEVNGIEGLKKDENYLVIANHRSWADILVLQSLLIKGAPIIKFIVKQEILFVPLVGLICWAYEYPFVRRESMSNRRKKPFNSDINTINRSFGNLGKNPMSIVNFVEGTRFNPLKRRRSRSKHDHLLKPKAGGLTNILQTYGSQIDYLLDFTIAYDIAEPLFWNMLNGSCSRIKVDVRKIPMSSLLKKIESNQTGIDYKAVSAWLEAHWEEKDRKLAHFLQDFTPVSN